MTRAFNTAGLPIKLKFNKHSFLLLLLTAITLGVLWRSLPRVLDGVSFSREVYASDHSLLRLTLSGDEKYRIYSPLEKISPTYQEAVLLLEDQYFYYHPGFNPVALFKAAFMSFGNDVSPGASTITMQLARIRYGLKTKTVKGKLLQIIRALQIELTHNKKEILEAYLNLVPFGGPVEGVSAASLIFFDKPASQLTLSESLLLAVIPQSPSRRNLDHHNLDPQSTSYKAKSRLLQKWVAAHPKDQSRITDVTLPVMANKIKSLPFLAPHFTELALRMSSQNLIETTLNLKVQRQIEEKLKNYVTNLDNLGIKNGAALVVNNETHETVAYVGSADFFNSAIEGQVDGIMAKRSPGSSLKPFVYALAFQQGLIQAQTLVKDTPIQFAIYDPENFDQKFLGPISAEQALIQSRNVPALTLSNQLHHPNLYEFLKSSAQVYLPKDENYYGLSLVLGGTEVSPWELAGLYSSLANKGFWAPTQLIKNSQASLDKNILTPESSFAILDMLTHSPRPQQNYRREWIEDNIPVAWKTGTSHGFRDAWTAGVMGPYTIVVWFGNFNNDPNPSFVGRELAAPFFFQIIDTLSAKSFATPAWNSSLGLQLKKVAVCSVSGHLPHPHCPHLSEVWYQPGISPIAKCDIHRSLIVNKKSGLRSCDPQSLNNQLKVFEFWPSDLKRLFDLAGIHRLDPPDFDSHCTLTDKSSSGKAPSITTPTDHVTYLKSLTSKKELNTLTVSAVSDADAQDLYWFIDKDFIGKSKSHETLSFIPQPGEHVLSVVDSLGRTDQKKLSVQTIQ